jgi:hypothetical protein
MRRRAGEVWPFMAGEDDECDQPWTWDEAQMFIERPRMMRESEAEHATRKAIAKLSREIRASLQDTRNRTRYE